jgi:hypothetical protein
MEKKIKEDIVGYIIFFLLIVVAMIFSLVRVIDIYTTPRYNSFCADRFGSNFQYGGINQVRSCVGISENKTSLVYYYFTDAEYNQLYRHPRFFELNKWEDVKA